jgi:hypothetical protein
MSAEDPEIEALTNRVLAQVFATAEANQEKFDLELLRLLGLLCVQFNFIEADFKYLLIVLREDDLPLREARKFALKVKWFSQLLDEVKKRFPKKFPDPAIVKEFKEIVQEADRLPVPRQKTVHCKRVTKVMNARAPLPTRTTDTEFTNDFEKGSGKC